MGLTSCANLGEIFKVDQFASATGGTCVVPLTQEELRANPSFSSSDSDVWKQESKAISLRVRTGGELNEVNSLPHSLMFAFFQMDKTQKFVKDISSQSGLNRLLLLEGLNDEIIQYDAKALQPKSSLRYDIDRAEKSRYVALVAGYNSLVAEDSVRLFQIPLVKKPRSTINPINWFTDQAPPFPAKLDVYINLGAKRIDTLVVNIRDLCS